MAPAESTLRSAGVLCDVQNRESGYRGRWNRPALVRKRNAARRQTWGPDDVKCIRAFFVQNASSRYTEEIIVNDGKIVSRRKSISWIENVRFSPTNELFSQFH